MIYLIDMDGVIADFDAEFNTRWKERHPDKFWVHPKERTTFYLRDNYPAEYRPLLEEIYYEPGFYKALPPVKGSISALEELVKKNEVFICTSSLLKNPACIKDKLEWVEKHLGSSWVKKTIITKDKTIVRGDFLIDDKPEIKGIFQPIWEHILYDQPYNQGNNKKKRITWQNWKQILYQ